jgi:hypothetical protein
VQVCYVCAAVQVCYVCAAVQVCYACAAEQSARVSVPPPGSGEQRGDVRSETGCRVRVAVEEQLGLDGFEFHDRW